MVGRQKATPHHISLWIRSFLAYIATNNRSKIFANFLVHTHQMPPTRTSSRRERASDSPLTRRNNRQSAPELEVPRTRRQSSCSCPIKGGQGPTIRPAFGKQSRASGWAQGAYCPKEPGTRFCNFLLGGASTLDYSLWNSRTAILRRLWRITASPSSPTPPLSTAPRPRREDGNSCVQACDPGRSS